MNIHYLIGDATNPQHKPCINPHCVNDIGAWGSGYVIAVSKINKEPEKAYHKWHAEGGNSLIPFELGATQILPFTKDMWIANMVAQHDTRTIDGVPPVRYDALEKCLESVYTYAKNNKLVVCCPRICGNRSGGDWKIIENIVQKMINKYQIETYIYTLEQEKNNWVTAYENDATSNISDLNALF